MPSAVPSIQSDAQDGAMGLDALAEAAARTHASVAARRDAVEAADAGQDGAWQQFLPSPSIETDQYHGHGRTLVASVSQPLWAGGRLTGGLDAAKARARSARFSVAETQQGLGFSVAQAYQNFMQARGQQQVLEDFLARLAAYQQRMDRRVSAGASPLSDLELVRSRVSGARAQLKTAQAAEAVALAQLSQLTGRRLMRTDILLDAAVSGPASTPAGLEQVIMRAEDFSPTLRRMAQDIEASRGDATVSEAAMYPTLSVVAQHTQYYGVPGQQSDDSVMLQARFAPGAGLSALSQAHSAQAQVSVARENREAARVDLESRVRGEYENYRASVDSQPDLEANVRAAGNVLASYERLFIAGKRSWQDVMSAASSLSDAGIGVVNITAQRVASRYRLALYDGESHWMTSTND